MVPFVLCRSITSTDHRRNSPWILNTWQFVRVFINRLGLYKIARAISRANKQFVLEKPRLNKDLESKLREYFRNDIENL